MSLATSQQLFASLSAIAARSIEIRHLLHRHPELGYEERFTSSTVCEELDRLGVPYVKHLAGGTGVLATLQGTLVPSDRCVALRADMDALPITEETGLPYASERPGLMHACGHDGHTAILLGVAAVLKPFTDRFSGTIKLLFQPAEEGGCGADRMVKDGVLQNPQVEAIFGLHGWPGLKVGMAATRPGPLLASVDGFKIQVLGRGGHAAAPQETIDPIICAASVVQGLQTIVSREADPTEPCVVTISQINAGSAFNVIPDHVTLQGTIRALSPRRRAATLAALERITRGIAAAFRCEVNFEYFGTTPVTANTPELAAFIANTARRVLGDRAYVEVPKPVMWGEDFAFYVEQIPGCFFLLGVQPEGRDSYPMLHNPGYDFTDAAVPIGIRMLTEAALGWLAAHD